MKINDKAVTNNAIVILSNKGRSGHQKNEASKNIEKYLMQ